MTEVPTDELHELFDTMPFADTPTELFDDHERRIGQTTQTQEILPAQS